MVRLKELMIRARIGTAHASADGNFDWANESNCLCAPTNDCEATEGKFVIGGGKYSWHLVEPEGATSFTIKVDLYEMNYSITANYK